jgi:hypothetical protein
MKVIIAGGTKYTLTEADFRWLDVMRTKIPITEVVCGKAEGADTGGEEWAKKAGVPVKPFPADWDRYYNAAGPIRNGEMANYADALIAFPGHTGTADMVCKMTRRFKPIFYPPQSYR